MLQLLEISAVVYGTVCDSPFDHMPGGIKMPLDCKIRLLSGRQLYVPFDRSCALPFVGLLSAAAFFSM